MAARDVFEPAWLRCAELRALYLYLAQRLTAALSPDEILRAEWAARVSALDLYVHEIVAERMLEIFSAVRSPAKAFIKFQISSATLLRIRAATNNSDAEAAFDLEVRENLGRQTFQFPGDIADAVRFVSDIELWNEIAIHVGASQADKIARAKSIKKTLSAIVVRRNRIVHEGDLQSAVPRAPYPISVADLMEVETHIAMIVDAIETLV